MDDCIRVSRNAVWLIIILLAVITGFLMLGMLNVDLDELLGADHLAIKVGGTSITQDDFASLKRLSEPESGSIGDTAFAEELLETLLYAEAGRQLGLDKAAEFTERVQAFDRAIAISSGPVDLSKALFLLEELARRTRARILAAADAEIDAALKTSESEADPAVGVSTGAARLHLRTALAADEAAATSLMAAADDGTPFSELNASWSRSPYAASGGDLGWVGPEDLPPGVFERLEDAPVGSLTRAFSDVNGVHFFLVEARPAAVPGFEDRRRAGRLREEHRRRAVDRFLQTMRTTMPWFVHPTLRRP